MTDRASTQGINATPTILVNGVKLPSHDLKTLDDAIAKADAKGPAPQPSASSSASPSASSTP
jgi:hypothetical protein